MSTNSYPGLFPCNLKVINENESVKKMAARLYRKSQSEKTVRAYVEALVVFSNWLKAKPDESIKKKYDWAGMVNEFIDHLITERKCSNATVSLYATAIKKWLVINEVPVSWEKLELPKIWRVERDRLLSKEELREILNGADLTSRVMILALVSSGLRVGALIKLKLKDVRMEYDTPLIAVGPEISKTREGYITFMSKEAKSALLQYLKERELNGEKITPESFLVVKERPRGTPITTQGAMFRWHRLLKKANKATKGRKWYEAHIHTLRKYFKSWASLSGVPEALVEAFMGHRRGIQQTYFLPGLEAASNPEVVKRVMAEYAKALPALTIFSEEEKVKALEGRLEETRRQLEEGTKRHEGERHRLEEERRLLEERVRRLEGLVTKTEALRRRTLIESAN